MALNPLSSVIALSQLRASLVRARRFVQAQPPMIRLLLASIVLTGFGSIFYLSGQPFSPASKPYLRSGKSFSQDELLRVCKALDGHVLYWTDAKQRVQVDSDQFNTASGLLSKVDSGIRSVEELRIESLNTSPFESISDKQRRELLSQEKILESLIDGIPEIAWSYVKINQSKPTIGLRSTSKVSAFVSVETRDDSELSYRTVEKIRLIIVRNVNDLAPDAVTVVDRKADTYLDADNTTLQTISRDRAREEQLRQDIFKKLDWIKGVRVSVQMTPPSTMQAVAAPVMSADAVNTKSPGQPELRWARKDSKAPARGRETSRPRTVVAANQPLERTDVSAEVDESVVTVDPPAVQETPPAELTPAKTEPSACGKIAVEVPRSFYYRNYMIATQGEKEPSPDAIKLSMVQIESKIRESVKMMIPGSSESWEIRVGMIPDDVPLVRASAVPHVPESRRQALGWEVIGVVVTLVVVTSVWAMVRYGRRPEVRTSVSSGSRRFHRDSPSGPAPSERVRELVRRNPQAAASVLQRWIGQGGDVA